MAPRDSLLLKVFGIGGDIMVFLHLAAFIPFVILVSLKADMETDMSWWQVFTPQFIASGLSFYFLIATSLRLQFASRFSLFAGEVALSFISLLTFFTFMIVLCARLAEDLSCSILSTCSPLMLLLIFNTYYTLSKYSPFGRS